MTRHQKPNPSMMPTTSTSPVAVPDYLKAHYWWAYVHPKAVRFFERQWLVNLILWGNYGRLRNAVLAAMGNPIAGKNLQVACAYGDLTPGLVGRLGSGASLDVIDILPVQLGNLSAKLEPSEAVRLHCMNSAALRFSDASFDRVMLFFLLHEQPADVREQTLQEAIRVLKPGGTMVLMDYSRPRWYNPFRYVWKPILNVLEPFASDLFDKGVGHWVPEHPELTVQSRKTFAGGVYELLVIRRAS